jgi:hypothetical protein
MVHKAGVGPAPVPIKQLTTEKLCELLRELTSPAMASAAQAMAEAFTRENGVKEGAAGWLRGDVGAGLGWLWGISRRSALQLPGCCRPMI